MAENVSVEFVSTSILRIHEFSWVFLVDWIMIILLSIFAIFYFNQLLGFIVTHTVGWYVWHRYDVYFKVESVQISLFAGRVMFSNVVYIGTSEAARIVYGSIGWRYWIRNRRRSALVGGSSKGECALELKANGLEWFVYNREYAYDVLGKNEPASAELAREFDQWQANLSTVEHRFSELLPMRVAARNIAVVIGNEDTESLLVMSAPSADGVIDMDVASNESDRYSLRIDMHIEMPEVELRANPDYQVSSIEPIQQNRRSKQPKSNKPKPKWILKLRHRRASAPSQPWMGLRRYMEDRDATETSEPIETPPPETELPKNQPRSPLSQQSPLGESPMFEKKMSAETASQSTSFHSDATRISVNKQAKDDEKTRKPLNPGEVRSRLAALPTEYAKVSQILACDRLDLYVLSDIVGNVDVEHEDDSEPLYSVSLRLHESKINYGPWTERQRQQFWSLFFPRQCVDASVPDARKMGELRLQKRALLAVELLGESVLVVPVREKSKDESFAASFARNFGTFGDEIQRNYGWVELRALEGSSISAMIPYVPDDSGFQTECSIEFKKPEVRSSVTHDTMFFASSHRIEITQHVPLVWNARQTWDIHHESSNMDFFALREHVTLISDTINDFADGPPTPYALFVPQRYNVTWRVINFALFLNVNKNNIINNPTSRSENTFLVLRTPDVSFDWDMPQEEITAPTTATSCRISAKSLDLELNAPNWHTLQSFLDSQRMARVEDFEVQWSLFSSTLSPEHRFTDSESDVNLSRYVDTQVINIKGSRLAMIAYGFLVDYIMRVRENYFGHAYHFQTTEEFLQKHETNQEPTFDFSRVELDMDAHVHIYVDKGVFLLPQYLYSAKSCLALHFDHHAMDCRFTNYYMDLQAEFVPVVGVLLQDLEPQALLETALENKDNSILSISQLEIRAHRMFGLPPSEPTYVVRWDFDIGDISLNADTSFLPIKTEISRSFMHGFADDENKPIGMPEELNDVTFVSANVASLVATLSPAANDDLKISVEIGPIKGRVNDLANARYSGRATLEIPFVQLKCFNKGDVIFEATTAIYMTRFEKKPYASEQRAKQQAHLALHDSLFHRATFLLEPHVKNSEPFARQRQPDDVRPCIPLPPFAPPLTRETAHMQAPAGSEFNHRRHNGDSVNGSEASIGDPDSINQRHSPRYSFDEGFGSNETLGSAADATSYREPRRSANEVYPFASSEATSERARLRRKHTDFKLHATSWRPNAPAPTDDDEECEHLSVIIQVTAVNVEVTPEIFAVAAALDFEPEVNFEAELDSLQHSIVKALVRKEAVQERARIHFVMPLLSINLRERLRGVHGVLCETKDIDFMWSSSESQRGIHAECSSLSIALRQGGGTVMDLARINAASIVLSKLVLWWSEIDNRKGAGALDFAGVDLSVATDQIDWIISYAAKLAASVASSSATRRRNAPRQRPKTMSAMFYALTNAGEQMGVEQDSYVLSRPSGAIQSRSHVRSQISWRIVMRLRYLLQRIPPTELNKMQRNLARGRLQLPTDARQRMLAIYRRWRSWEQSDELEDSEIFKQVLQDQSFQEYVLSMSTRLALNVESMVVRLVYPDMREHYVGLDLFVIHLASMRMNETQNLGLTVRCSKIRAFGSIEIVLVAAAIISAVADAEDFFVRNADDSHKLEGDSEIFPDSDDDEVSIIQHPWENIGSESLSSTTESGKGIALQANVSIFLLDLVLEFDLETVKIETQNHQVQFAASIELMQTSVIDSLFHSGVLATSNGAFRIFRPTSDEDILDSLITGIHIGYASRGPSHQSNTWATVNADSLSLAIHPAIPGLADLVVEFLETELPVLKTVGEKLSEASAKRGQSADQVASAPSHASITSLYSPLNELGAGQFVNLAVPLMKLRFTLIDDLMLVLQGRQLDAKLRHTDALVGSLELERGTIGMHYGEGLASVAKVQIETAKSVARVDNEHMAITFWSDLGALRMETMSLIWLLDYVRHRKLDTQLADLIGSVNHAMELVRDVMPGPGPGEVFVDAVSDISDDDVSVGDTGKTEGDDVPSKFRFRLINRIREISIILPLDTSSFTLTLADISAKFEHFKSIDDLKKPKGPQTIAGNVGDLALRLSLPHKRSREMIRLQFSVDARQEDERDSFNVQSEYIRFALDPDAVGAIFVAVNKLKQHTQALFRSTRQSVAQQVQSPKTSAPLVPLIPAGNKNDPKSFRLADLERLRINLLLKSLTVTWFTDMSSKDGIILGYDRLQVRVAKLFARLELEGTYVTPVVPPDSENRPISERSNTAYLPLVDARLYVTEKRGEIPCVHLSMTGKSVTLLLTSSVAPWVLKLSNSWAETRTTVINLARQKPSTGSSSRPEETPISPTTAQRSSPLEMPFALRADMHFERGILRVLEENGHSKDPALELFSPSVDILAELMKNRLLLRVDVSPTTNKMYPKAISEIKAISSQLSSTLGQHQAEHSSVRRSPSPPPLSSLASPTNPSLAINDLELDIRVQLGTQELYLSCLPFGKVGALISTEQVDLLMITSRPNVLDETFVVGQMFIRGARVSLQHIYSREISGMAEFSRLSLLGMYRVEEPFKLAISLKDPQIMMKLGKLHDMRTFFEIWKFYEDPNKMGSPSPEPEPKTTTLRRKYSTSSHHSRPVLDRNSQKELKETEAEKGRFIDRYKSAVASVNLPLTVNVSVINLSVVLGMGPSIGDIKFTVDRIWGAFLKSSTAEQAIHAGIDSITAHLDGRLGGTVRMDALMAKGALHWEDGRDYPLLHAKLRMGKLGFYFSLDFHPFIAGEIVATAVAITTQDRLHVDDSRIYTVASCESASFVFTALVASHTFDVITLFKRLQSQISNAPIFMAQSSQSTSKGTGNKLPGKDAKNSGIRTIFDLKLGNLMMHVFPTEFTDTVALKIFADRISVHFDRKEQEHDYTTGMDFALNECLIGLANIRGGGYPHAMMDLNYEEYLTFVRRSASGGTIVNTPEISMLMDTVEPKGKNEVHYTFSNELLGSVEVGWNLGSVNFIKEMLDTHKQALATRPMVSSAGMPFDEDADSVGEPNSSRYRAGSLGRSSSISTTLTGSSEPDVAESLDTQDDDAHVDSSSDHNAEQEDGKGEAVMFAGTRYVATTPPVILIPQLRDLGDATPPIEWLGVNRERLPLFLHHLVTRKLEMGAEELEKVYRDVMGRLD